MSILNVHIEPLYALVGVDTAGAIFHADGTERRTSLQKATIVGDTLVGGRGNLSLYTFLTVSLLSQPERLTVDRLVGQLEEQCGRALQAYDEFRSVKMTGMEPPTAASGLEITVVGWSAAFGQMVGVVATMQSDSTFTVERIPHACAAPGIWDAGQIPDLSTPDAMLAAMREQVERFTVSHPNAPIGGQVVLYTLDPMGVRVEAAANLTARSGR